MNKENQIIAIKKFINSKEKTLLVNQVNEDIALFYLMIIKHFAKHEGIQLNHNAHTDGMAAEEDLFGTVTIHIFNITNLKTLDTFLNSHHKKIIFTDYKNYKRLSSKANCINGYQFENDMTFFIRDELNIQNDELLYYCKNNTALLFSETSKYLINSVQYSSDRSIVEEKNNILDIRKKIFAAKRNSIHFQSLYESIKKEVEYKKFSFLAF